MGKAQGPLVLSRKKGELVIVNVPGFSTPATIEIVEIRGDKTRLSFMYPESWSVHRSEVSPKSTSARLSVIEPTQIWEIMLKKPFLARHFPFRCIVQDRIIVTDVLQTLSRLLQEASACGAKDLFLYTSEGKACGKFGTLNQAWSCDLQFSTGLPFYAVMQSADQDGALICYLISSDASVTW